MGDNRESLISHFKATHLTPETSKDGQTLSTEEIERYTIKYITFFLINNVYLSGFVPK